MENHHAIFMDKSTISVAIHTYYGIVLTTLWPYIPHILGRYQVERTSPIPVLSRLGIPVEPPSISVFLLFHFGARNAWNKRN